MLKLFLFMIVPVLSIYQILPEKPTDFRIRLCSHERQPMQVETMLYFPETVKFCSSLTTNKNVINLANDRQKTTFLQPLISISIHELGSTAKCRINYMGYGGEYRLSPDLGYYKSCQRSISMYINQLVDRDPKPEWNSTNSKCPIQNLPNSYQDYIACDLMPNRWYQLEFQSAIQYEIFHEKFYRHFSSNYSTTFFFKPDYFLNRNGTENDWIFRLIHLKAKLKKCEKVRYFLRIDEHFNLPIFIQIEYRIVENDQIKYVKKIGNGTIDHWFTGNFVFIPSPSRDHEICVKFEWSGSRPIFLCQKFAFRGQCYFNFSSAISNIFIFIFILFKFLI